MNCGTKFYVMGTGKLIAEAGRGTTIKAIKKLQKREWAQKQGGITEIRTLTSPHAIYFAMKNL